MRIKDKLKGSLGRLETSMNAVDFSMRKTYIIIIGIAGVFICLLTCLFGSVRGERAASVRSDKDTVVSQSDTLSDFRFETKN